ncbi:hypothetical protein M3J09_009258 [Ascochyta lentis]
MSNQEALSESEQDKSGTTVAARPNTRSAGLPVGCKVTMVATVLRVDGSVRKWEEKFQVAEARPRGRTTSWEYRFKFSNSGKEYKDHEGCEWFLENTPTLEKVM